MAIRSPLVYALRVCAWAWFACLWTGARAGTFPSFNDTPTTVNSFQDALTTAFQDRTALLLANSTGVVGGTGSANGRLVFIECAFPASRCFPDSAGEYVAVLKEDTLPAVLRMLAVDRDTDGVPSIPSSIIVLPSAENSSFSPAPVRPLVDFQPTSEAKTHSWNPRGAEVLDIAVPFGVFLAPREEAPVIEKHTKANGARGWNGAEFGSTVRLETRIDLDGNSTDCVTEKTCVPMGGYSVWASMPPQSNTTGAARGQVLVLSHWDSQGLFRSIISGTHSAQSGLVAMLLAADILSSNGRGEGYEKDIIFTSLSGEAFDLMASRKMAYDLQNKQDDPRAAENLDGVDLNRLDAIVEVGMLGFDQGAYNGSGGSGGDLFVHTAAQQSTAAGALLAAANATSGSLSVSMATQSYLPPSSLLLWQKVLADVDAVYLGDFDSEFTNEQFWDHNDDGLIDWSATQVARAATILAEALHSLAGGSSAATPLQIDTQAVEAHAQELFDCLGRPEGLKCDLVQYMSDPFKDAAEQFVSVLRARPEDEQDRRSSSKKSIEVFVWEYLANRTFVGEPQQVADGDKFVDCRHTKHTCGTGQVCLHEYSVEDKAGGKCVRASVKFSPSHSTLFDYRLCGENDDSSCEEGWELVSPLPQWAADLDLPPDKGWAETYNENISVDVNLRESSSRDWAVFIAGICCTVGVLAAVLGGQAVHGRFKID